MIPAHPLRGALCAAVIACLSAGGARAQQAAEQAPEAASPAPYVDRVIAPAQLPELPPDEDEDADAAATLGPPRSVRVELDLARSERGSERFDETGLSANGFWETADLGAFSLDATVFHSGRDRLRGDGGLGGSATLWQRNLDVDGGWRLDNGLGVQNTPAPPLQRDQSRFFLPTVPFAGASTQWVRGDLQLQGAFGRGGIYTGTRVVGFDAGDGEVAELGAQWRWAPGWTGAAAFLGTDGRIVPDGFGDATLVPERSRALYAATAWRGERDTVQANLLGSGGDRADATGAWIDASSRRGRYQHGYGLFRLAPQLAWGALPINNDLEGGYYRLGYQYGRWLWSGGLDRIRSVSDDGFDGLYGTAFARYQASTNLGLGGSLNLRSASGFSHSAQLFADRRTPWGQTRVQLDEADSVSGRSWQLGVDHALPLRQGARLSASLAYGELQQEAGGREGTITAALNGGRDLGNRLHVDGNLRWLSADGANARRGLDMNVSADWRIASHWSLVGSIYRSQGSRRSVFVLDPLQTEVPFVSLPRDRAVFLTLRYQREAGRPRPVIGGAPGSAVGELGGIVFLDENGNGLRDAAETAVPNITVVLDGRYSVRTDAAGRYEFPRVAVGTHTLQVEPDNLPLPWSFEGENARRQVTVGVRDDARVDLGARRPR